MAACLVMFTTSLTLHTGMVDVRDFPLSAHDKPLLPPLAGNRTALPAAFAI